MMRRASPRANPAAAAGSRTMPLSVIHAEALYRPVPPVACDDHGYPFEDEGVSESSAHDEQRGYAAAVLRQRYLDDPTVSVGSGQVVHIERGNRAAMVEPDVFVAFDAVKHPRLSYKIWEEPGPPDFVLELVSFSNWRRDVFRKPDLYADLGVREYWLADPNGGRGDGGPLLVGHSFRPGGVREVQDATLAGYSEVLELELVVDDGYFRFRDPTTGQILPAYHEMTPMRDDAEARAQAAEARAAELERRLDDLGDGGLPP
ncbi:MAG: Uma2 family endonuclease [Gammaproteobacteria bacterium]|nr:Uma2 family endonuclease [Gammaproteobacteria bacterium]